MDMLPVEYPADIETLRVGTDEITVLAGSADTSGDLFAVELRMPPGGGPPVMHRHAPSAVYRVLSETPGVTGEIVIPLVPEMEPETEAAPIAIAAPREEAIVPVAEAPVGGPLAEPAACTERSRSRRHQRGARRKARRRQKSAPSAPRASAQGRGGAKQAATSSFNNGFGNQGPW